MKHRKLVQIPMDIGTGIFADACKGCFYEGMDCADEFADQCIPNDTIWVLKPVKERTMRQRILVQTTNMTGDCSACWYSMDVPEPCPVRENLHKLVCVENETVWVLKSIRDIP